MEENMEKTLKLQSSSDKILAGALKDRSNEQLHEAYDRLSCNSTPNGAGAPVDPGFVDPPKNKDQSDFSHEVPNQDDELRSLHKLVNFQLSEILPSGMAPLDNSRNYFGDEKATIGENKPRTSSDNVLDLVDDIYSRSPLKHVAQVQAPKSILFLTERALKERRSLTVDQICHWISSYNGDLGSTATPEQRLRRQMVVENVLNCYPQFSKVSYGNKKLWMILKKEDVLTDPKPPPKITSNCRANHWKKQKLAEYKSSSSKPAPKPAHYHTEPPYQEEPLNLVIRPQEEPLNLVVREMVHVQNTENTYPVKKEESYDFDSKQERRKSIKKVFSKISSKSGLAQWTLKKKKSRMKSMKSILKRNCLIQKTENSVCDQNQCPEILEGLEKLKDTKIKLIKVGDSYKVASKATVLHEDTVVEMEESSLVIDEEATEKNVENQQNDTAVSESEVSDECVKEPKPEPNTCHNAESGAKKTSGWKIPPKALSRENQAEALVEEKPVWIQIPTNSGGAKVVPLVVPNSAVQTASAGKATRVKPYTKPQNKGVNHQSKTSNFPRLTDSNKCRKVFKLEDDGSINCLGTLEEVEKSGLLSTGPLLKGSETKPTTLGRLPIRPDRKGSDVHKIRTVFNPVAIDLRVQKPLNMQPVLPLNRLTWFVPNNTLLAPQPLQLTNIAPKPMTPVVVTTVASSTSATTAVTTTVTSKTPMVPVRRGLLVPLQQNMKLSAATDVKDTNTSTVPSKSSKSTESENIGDSDNGGERKIRREMKNRIKESYYDKNKRVQSTTQIPSAVQGQNFKPNFPFQPFSPLYLNSMGQFSSTSCTQGSGSPTFYPAHWPARPPYQVARPCLNSTKTFPYSHQMTLDRQAVCRPKLAASNTYVPSADKRDKTDGQEDLPDKNEDSAKEKSFTTRVPHLRV